MTNEKYDLILGFCLWLKSQGLAYETIYYGGKEDIGEWINQYLKEQEDGGKE